MIMIMPIEKCREQSKSSDLCIGCAPHIDNGNDDTEDYHIEEEEDDVDDRDGSTCDDYDNHHY